MRFIISFWFIGSVFSWKWRGGTPVFHFWLHGTTEELNTVSFFSFARLNVITWWNSDATQTAHVGHLSLIASRMSPCQRRTSAVMTLTQIYLNLMKGLVSCSYMHLPVSRTRTEAPMQDNMQNEDQSLNSDSKLAKGDSVCDEVNKVLFH